MFINDVNDISYQVWNTKYRYKDKEGKPIDETIEDTWRRVANACASKEADKEQWSKKFYSILEDFKFIPAGRILSNAGTNRKNTTYMNCYTLPDIEDDTEKIFESVRDGALTMRQGGGIGVNFSQIRPKGAWVKGVEAKASGPISFMHVFNSMCETIMSAGQRRGAMIAILNCDHPDIEEFIEAKRFNRGLRMFNLSVGVTDDFVDAVNSNKDWDLKFDGKVFRTIKAKDLWTKIMKSTYEYAEPGMIFLDRANYWNNLWYCEKITACNPCLAGETLVYLADGRGNVSIKQLAEEGNDVPVFCFDNNNKIVVRTLRHPRITGYNQPIYKITLDDGSSIRVTKNHKFMITSGEYKQVEDLKKGDSLKVVTRYQASIKDVFKGGNKNSGDYNWINYGLRSNKAEHRVIYEGISGKKIPNGSVIHHKDFDTSNNSFDNLVCVSKKDHDRMHGDNMIGDKNPMRRAKYEWSDEKWSDYRSKMSKAAGGDKNGRHIKISNDQIRFHAIKLVKKLGRRFGPKEWNEYSKENNIPIGSSFREEEIGNYIELGVWAAKKCGLKYAKEHPRTLESFNKMVKNGYTTKIVNGVVVVRRKCEFCGKAFWISFDHREQCFCSLVCSRKGISKRDNYRKTITEVIHNRSKSHYEQIKPLQIKAYLDLKQKIGREPFRYEWNKYCYSINLAFRTGTKFGFSSWEDLKEKASMYNHRVVSVELDGYENVYNGTVDDYHNFFVGAFESQTFNGKRKWSYLNNKQCGEVLMASPGICLLGSVNLTQFVKNPFSRASEIDLNGIQNTIGVAVRLLDNVIDITGYPLESQRASEKSKRRMGIGMTGFGDMLCFLGIAYGSEKSLEVARTVMSTITNAAYEASVELAKERGSFELFDADKYLESNFVKTLPNHIRQSIKKYGIRNSHLTSIAPTGTISLLAGNVSSGLEPIFALRYTRKINFEGGQTEQTVEDYAVRKYKEVHNKTELPDYFVTSSDVRPTQHIDVQAELQKYVDLSISKTINVPTDFPFDEFVDIYSYAYGKGLKGCTTFRPSEHIQGVLTTTASQDTVFKANEAPRRPEKLDCDIHHFQASGEKWVAFVGLWNDGRPYEIFAGKKEEMSLPSTYTSAKIIKRKMKKQSAKYDLVINPDGENEISIKNFPQYFKNDTHCSFTRMLSMNMRLGGGIKYIVRSLEKDENSDLHSFFRGVMRILKKYVKDGEECVDVCPKCDSKMVYADSCPVCTNCGYSKCG